MVGPDVAPRTNALEHDLSAVPVNYDELRWLSPNAVEFKSEFVAIKLCRFEDVIHNEVWRNAKQSLLTAHANLQLHASVLKLDRQVHSQSLTIRVFLNDEFRSWLALRLPCLRNSQHYFARVIAKILISISLIINVAAF